LNLCYLPVDDQVSCINGLVQARVQAATDTSTPANFDEWMERTMGEGITRIFMRPYNTKVRKADTFSIATGSLCLNIARLYIHLLRNMFSHHTASIYVSLVH
jgi:protoporphyrinogen oxidase